MRRILGVALLVLAACSYDAGPIRPVVTGPSTVSAPLSASGPSGRVGTFTPDGCPVDEPTFCEQAAALSNALVAHDPDLVFGLSRRVRLSCRELDPDEYPQCTKPRTLNGYPVRTYQAELFVQPQGGHRDLLRFMVASIDEDYSDDLGGPAPQVLGVSTCPKDGSYHVVATTGLSDPDSALPGDRFLMTFGFVEGGDGWAIEVVWIGLFSDWQLVLEDPLTQIACGDIQPWSA